MNWISIPLFVALGTAVHAVDSWPMFRGPNASGVSEGARPPAKFGLSENILWSVDVPESPSSPVVWGSKLFLTTFAAGKLETRCYDRATGTMLWNKAAPADKLEQFHGTEGSPAASTPALDARHVVSYFGSFGLVCYDHDGKELWQHALPLAVTGGSFGSGASPLIAGGMAIINRDLAAMSSTLALNIENGQRVWESLRPDSPTSYGTPILWRHDGTDEVVTSGSLTLKTYDLRTGAETWRLRGLPSYTCTTPVVGGDLLFFAGWSPGKSDSPFPSWEATLETHDKNRDGEITLPEFSGGEVWFKTQDTNSDGKITSGDWESILGLMGKGENILLAIKPGGKGDVTETHVAWRSNKGLPYVPSPLYYRGRVYIIKDGGMLSCFEAATGNSVYLMQRINAEGGYYASPVAADGRIYVASLSGAVTVLKAGVDSPEVIHQAQFGERIPATPALVADTLYLRTPTKLFAFAPPKPAL